MKELFHKIGKGFLYVFTFLGILLSTSVFWMLDTWQSLTIDEMLFHLRAPKTGTDSAIITGFLVRCLFPAVVAVVVTVAVMRLVKAHKKLWGCLIFGITAVAAAVSVSHAWKQMDIGSYVKNSGAYSSFIDDNYVYPSSVEITFPEEKRNLVYIYIESMETTFADPAAGGAFEENLIPQLTNLALENENFNGSENVLNGGVVLNKTTYTMGALYGHSMGLPLILPFNGNIMASQDSFMPQLDGIGDVLQEAGYKNTLLIGSQAVFGGRDLFYRDHGDYEILDYDYARENGEIPQDYYVFWGYEDLRLFEFAKKRILQDAASGQPFNLTMLTVDTHFEDGYVCEDCENRHGEDIYADVYNCADRRVAEFITWLQGQKFYENTTIVLAGDHLTMDSDFCKNVPSDYKRKAYLSIINGVAEVEADTFREYSTLDFFPTTLAALGVSIEGNRLGLGTNLYAAQPTLLEQYGEEEINTSFDRKSAMMEYLTSTVDMEKSAEMYSQEWYYKAYEFALDRGILKEEISSMGPDQNISKAAVLQAIYELEGRPKAKEKRAARRMFSDVKGAAYEEALNWACENGIVADDGSAGKFSGEEFIAREELMVWFYRYAAYKQADLSPTAELEGFTNANLVSAWAVEAMKWGVGSELIHGVGNQDLLPQGAVTLAQAATFFMRLCETYGL